MGVVLFLVVVPAVSIGTQILLRWSGFVFRGVYGHFYSHRVFSKGVRSYNRQRGLRKVGKRTLWGRGCGQIRSAIRPKGRREQQQLKSRVGWEMLYILVFNSHRLLDNNTHLPRLILCLEFR